MNVAGLVLTEKRTRLRPHATKDRVYTFEYLSDSTVSKGGGYQADNLTISYLRVIVEKLQRIGVHISSSIVLSIETAKR